MDNQTHNPENAWIDDKLASLVPAKEWHPDGHRALAHFKNRRDKTKAAASPRWIQLSMVAAVLVSIALVVTLLPWHVLWEGTKIGKELPTEPPKAATPEVLAEPAPAPPPPTPGQPQPLLAAVAAEVQQPEQPPAEPEQKSPVRVGPGVTPPRVIPPTVQPDYTVEANREHIQGTVVLSVIVRADGSAKVESIVKGLGFGLDEKAVEALEKWRFVPGTKDGKIVDVQLEVVINFKLY